MLYCFRSKKAWYIIQETCACKGHHYQRLFQHHFESWFPQGIGRPRPCWPKHFKHSNSEIFVQLWGNRDEKKLAVLNLSLLHFVQKYKRKTVPRDIPKSERGQFDLEFQPRSFDTRLKTLFGIFKSNGIDYGLKKFKKMALSFMVIYDHCEEIAKVRSGFGSLPKQAQFDIHIDDKLRSAIDSGRLDYKIFFQHFTMLIIQLLGKTAMLWGSQDVIFFLMHYIL